MGSDDDLGHELRVGVARLYRRFRAMRGSGDLGDAALDVLSDLQRDGPLTLTALSARNGVRPASMSQTVARLLAGGYAERTRDTEDRRQVLLSVTPAGADELARARTRGIEWLDATLGELSGDERAVLRAAAPLMERLARAESGPS